MERPVALVGLPAVGKSMLGARLAHRLGAPFVDTDRQVEAEAGMTVQAIFATEGEAGFRARERASVAALLDVPARVLALGGGAFQDALTRERLLRTAVTVWLDAPDPVLVERLAGGVDRPLFAEGDVASVLRRLRQERTPCYALAHHRVETGQGDPLEALVSLLG